MDPLIRSLVSENKVNLASGLILGQKWANSCTLPKENLSANPSTPRSPTSTPPSTSKTRCATLDIGDGAFSDQKKTTIGKVDEILGPINQVYFTIKPQEGIQATSFKEGDKFYIGGDKLLPLEK